MLIGTSRDRLFDKADPELPLSPVVDEFGKYLKVIVRFINEQEEICMNQGQGRSVVDVMRDAQRANAQPQTPQQVVERNQKDKLFNSIVKYLDNHNLFWRADEVDSLGVNFARSRHKIVPCTSSCIFSKERLE